MIKKLPGVSFVNFGNIFFFFFTNLFQFFRGAAASVSDHLPSDAIGIGDPFFARRSVETNWVSRVHFFNNFQSRAFVNKMHSVVDP